MRRCAGALFTAILLIACAGCFGDQDRIRFDNPDSRRYGEPDAGGVAVGTLEAMKNMEGMENGIKGTILSVADRLTDGKRFAQTTDWLTLLPQSAHKKAGPHFSEAPLSAVPLYLSCSAFFSLNSAKSFHSHL